MLVFLLGCSSTEIPFTEIKGKENLLFYYCLPFYSYTDKNLQTREFVINNDDEYQSLIQFKSKNKICTNFTLPYINFSQKTLLGKYTAGSCGAYFERMVLLNDNKRTYDYIINVRESFCLSGLPQESMNFITIPKIPEDYGVAFQVKASQNSGKIEILTKPGEKINFTERELLEKEGIGIVES